MDILAVVQETYAALSLPEREARTIAIASALEPLSDKAGCVTRLRDDRKNSLEMFVAAGVNIYPAYYRLAEYLLHQGSPQGMYQLFSQAVLLSKAQRKGGQINLGILEFSFPIVAAHVLYDPESTNDDYFFLLKKASELLKETTADDVQDLLRGKEAARDISYSHSGKRYEVSRPDVNTVFDYYAREYRREMDGGHPTGRVHNKQFVENFPDISLALFAYRTNTGKLSRRLVAAYNTVMTKPENLGIGPGLGADFIALTIYLALTYGKGEMVIE